MVPRCISVQDVVVSWGIFFPQGTLGKVRTPLFQDLVCVCGVLASRGWKSGMLVNTVQGTGQPPSRPPAPKSYLAHMSVVLRLAGLSHAHDFAYVSYGPLSSFIVVTLGPGLAMKRHSGEFHTLGLLQRRQHSV